MANKKILTLDNLVTYNEKVKDIYTKKSELKTVNGQSLFGEGELILKDATVNEIKQLFSEGSLESNTLSDKHTFEETSAIEGNSQVLRSVTYGNGYYVVVGASQTLAYSTDKGKTWIKKTFKDTSTNTFTGVAYGNGIFVAVEYTGATTGNIWVVDKPENEWKIAYSFNSYSLEGIKYANNTFLAVGTKGLIMKSDNGADWIQVHNNDIWHQQNPEIDAATNCPDLIDITYGNGKYVACGRNGLTLVSVNGFTWYDYSDTEMTRQTRTVHYANGVFLRGVQPLYDANNQVLISGILYSTDGVNWHQATINTTLKISYVRGFAYSNNRLYSCAYGTYGEIYESTDGGQTWNVVYTNGTSSKNRLWNIAGYDGLFLAVGDKCSVVCLDMDVTWTNHPPVDKPYYYKTILTLSDGTELESNIVTHYLPKTTTYESKSAVKNGTDLSLVTTGEKYNWDMKQDAISAATKLPAAYVSGLATVATSGSYNDLTNKPTIPAKVSQLENDSNFITKTEFETTIGDINSVLDLILGEDN